MDLEAAQPYYVLRLLPPEEVPAIACNDLAEGRAGAALVELASLTRPTWRDIGTLVDRALEEIGVPRQTTEQAWRALVALLLNEVDRGTVSIREAACQLGMLTPPPVEVPEALLTLQDVEHYLELGLLTDEQWEIALEQELREVRQWLEGSAPRDNLDEYGWGALYWIQRYGRPSSLQP